MGSVAVVQSSRVQPVLPPLGCSQGLGLAHAMHSAWALGGRRARQASVSGRPAEGTGGPCFSIELADRGGAAEGQLGGQGRVPQPAWGPRTFVYPSLQPPQCLVASAGRGLMLPPLLHFAPSAHNGLCPRLCECCSRPGTEGVDEGTERVNTRQGGCTHHNIQRKHVLALRDDVCTTPRCCRCAPSCCTRLHAPCPPGWRVPCMAPGVGTPPSLSSVV